MLFVQVTKNVNEITLKPALTIPRTMLNEGRVGSFYFPMLLRPSPFHA